MGTELIPLGFFNLCVFEEGNITTVYCHVKSNKVYGKRQVFLEAGSFLMYPLVSPFYFPRKRILFYLKDKGGRRGKITHFFVDPLVCLSIVPAEGLSKQLGNNYPKSFYLFLRSRFEPSWVVRCGVIRKRSLLLGVCSWASPRRVMKEGPALALLAVTGQPSLWSQVSFLPHALAALSSHRSSSYFANRSWASPNYILLLGCRYKWWSAFCPV